MKNPNSQGFTEKTGQYSVLTICSNPRGGFLERGNQLLESREGLLAEVYENSEQIADLLFPQISLFKNFLHISLESPKLIYFKIWDKL